MPQWGLGNVKVNIEIPVLLLFFAFILSESVGTNMIIFRTCYVTLGYNKSDCALLGTNYSSNSTEYLEKIVQPKASVITMTQSLITSFASVILCFFVGPWSDRYGRKPILVIPLIGFCISYGFLIIYSLIPNLSPWFILLTSIPTVLTGGGSCYLAVLFSYITDVTTESNRGLKMGIFEAVLSLGIFFGNIVASYVFKVLDYYGVFLISGLCCLFAALYTIWFIPESLQNIQSEGGIKELLQISNLTDMVKCAFKKRKNYDRCIILCCIVMLSIFILIINGDASVMFLFLREKFDFSLETYTLYNAAHNLTWVLGTIIGVYCLHKLLKVPETILTLIGLIALLNSCLVQAFADRKWEIYAAAFARSPGGPISPMIRSLVSKIVPGEDVGKIFALIITTESLLGMTGSPLYTEVYNRTLKIDSAIFNFVSAGFYGFCLILAIFITVLRTIQNKEIIYGELESEAEDASHSEDSQTTNVIN